MLTEGQASTGDTEAQHLMKDLASDRLRQTLDECLRDNRSQLKRPGKILLSPGNWYNPTEPQVWRLISEGGPVYYIK